MRIDGVTYNDLRRWADEQGSAPRVHGNGFIQVDTPMVGRRLNVWGHPDIPRQSTPTPVHDHRFGFVSTCIRGSLLNIVYHVMPDPDGTFDIYECRPRSGEDTELVAAGVRHSVLVSYSETVRADDPNRTTYCMGARLFHETVATRPSATVMTKVYKRDNHVPRVLCPVGQKPDNDFVRHDHDVENLWRIIGEVLEES